MSRDFTEGSPLDTITKISLLDGGWIRNAEQFYTREEADRLFRELRNSTDWENHRQPRLIKWYGDFDYVYTGASHRAKPLTPLLVEIRRRAEEFTFGESCGRFQGVLLNLYRDGRDSVGFHADDESVIRPDSPIASISLGAVRRFVLKYVGRLAPTAVPTSPLEFQLAHGSCLVMGGTTQRFWKHSIPKNPTASGARINLTFREYNA